MDDAGPGGLPVTITNGTISVSDVGSSSHALATGAHGTNWNVLVHSGSPLLLQIAYSRGTDPKLDLNNYHANIAIPTALSCDEVWTQKVVVPGVGSPGQITGTVAMAGETVLLHNSTNTYNLNTVMVADNSFTEVFYQWGRYTFLDSIPLPGHLRCRV